MQLDAMFIDEGFGTLDEHKYCGCFAYLADNDKAKRNGWNNFSCRDIKGNIADGIEVCKTRKGSTISI